MADRKSDPLYPAADPNVIAVTATDSDDHLFPMANRGRYIAVSAPGVDIFALAPGDEYLFTTGTSIAAAHVSGIAALLLEHKPSLKPGDIRAILDGHRQAARAAAPGFGFWCRPGERLSRRDVARPQPGGADRRRRASEAVIVIIVERHLNYRPLLRTNVRSVHLLEHRHERSGERPE